METSFSRCGPCSRLSGGLANTPTKIPNRDFELPSDPDDQRHLHLPTKSSLRTFANMSDGEVEVESPSGYAVLPKDVTDEIGSIKLFNKWSYEDVEIRDISLTYGTTILLQLAQFPCGLQAFVVLQYWT
jgi:hypothetical protein